MKYFPEKILSVLFAGDFLRYEFSEIRKKRLKKFFFLFRRKNLVKLGTEYGGWIVPLSLLSKKSICYCVGAGEDISFEETLINKVGCRIFTFDPTPRAEKYVINRIVGTQAESLHFIKVGLWSEDSIQKFYEPLDKSHVSHSILNLQKTEKYFEAPCLRLSSLKKLLGHHQIDLLKMDIEGAESAVIKTLGEDKIFPTILCLEFDEARVFGKDRLTPLVNQIKSYGYYEAAIDGWNYTFIRPHFL